MYLIALHGNGDWVTGYFNRNFYLNQRLIKENRLDASDVRAEAAEFLARMSGVSGVYTIDDIIASRAGDNANELKRNTLVKYAKRRGGKHHSRLVSDRRHCQRSCQRSASGSRSLLPFHRHSHGTGSEATDH